MRPPPLSLIRKIPDLRAPGRLVLTALVATLIASAVLSYIYWGDLDVTLGDTDDATRLVLVRQLIAGQGWWDQHFMRFQPPVGVYMHWSRLLDGGIATLNQLFRLALSGDDAETATRFVWPLLWIFPAALAALAVAKRLGGGLMGGAVVLICAVCLASDVSLYIQFHPGRIDHHDVQMTLCMLALAGAVQGMRSVWGAVLSGVATGLGMAVGLEAIVFDAIIGAGIALRFVADPRQAQAARAYGLALLVSTVAAFGVQTPPWRWGVAGCDAIAINLVAALALAGVGVTAVASLTVHRPWWARLLALGVVGALAVAVYFGIDPNCRHGFFADVDPRIRPIWLNFVQEVRPINKVWKRDQVQAAGYISAWTVGVLAWIGLGLRRERRTDPAWLITGACLIPSVVVAANALRMTGYAEWFAIPVVAAAAVEVAKRYERGGVFITLLAGAVASPLVASGLAQDGVRLAEHKPLKEGRSTPINGSGKAAGKLNGKPAEKPREHCFDTDSYDELADAEPAGVVLSEVDLGPFVVANTDHSTLAAPYHRMSWGILKAHALLSAPADGAADMLLRQAGVSYVLECRFHARHGDRDTMTKDSLQKRLDRGQPPAWLQPLSPRDAPIQAYRVLAAAPAAAPAPAFGVRPAQASR